MVPFKILIFWLYMYSNISVMPGNTAGNYFLKIPSVLLSWCSACLRWLKIRSFDEDFWCWENEEVIYHEIRLNARTLLFVFLFLLVEIAPPKVFCEKVHYCDAKFTSLANIVFFDRCTTMNIIFDSIILGWLFVFSFILRIVLLLFSETQGFSIGDWKFVSWSYCKTQVL